MGKAIESSSNNVKNSAVATISSVTYRINSCNEERLQSEKSTHISLKITLLKIDVTYNAQRSIIKQTLDPHSATPKMDKVLGSVRFHRPVHSLISPPLATYFTSFTSKIRNCRRPIPWILFLQLKTHVSYMFYLAAFRSIPRISPL